MAITLSPAWLQFPREVFCHLERKSSSVQETLGLIQSSRKQRDALTLTAPEKVRRFNGFVLKIVFHRISGVTIDKKHNASGFTIEITNLARQDRQSEINRQNETLEKVTQALENGLDIHRPPNSLDVKDLIVEDERTGDQFNLVSLHSPTNSRIAGWYNTRTKTIYLCYYFAGHGEWNYFLNNLERYARRQERFLEAVG